MASVYINIREGLKNFPTYTIQTRGKQCYPSQTKTAQNHRLSREIQVFTKFRPLPLLTPLPPAAPFRDENSNNTVLSINLPPPPPLSPFHKPGFNVTCTFSHRVLSVMPNDKHK